ncbi:MAG: hypothetical protein ACON38_18340 [Akkermansiaceae bacterium]
MRKLVRIFTQTTMALLLSLGLIVPAFALPVIAGEEPCAHCLVIKQEQERPQPSCCSEEEPPRESSRTPCQDHDCECPGCPTRSVPPSPVLGILPPLPLMLGTSGAMIFSPDLGPEFEQLNEAPPSPPPRQGLTTCETGTGPSADS